MPTSTTTTSLGPRIARRRAPVLLLAALVATLPAPFRVHAQEVRFSWNGGYSGEREVGFGSGYGGGVRVLVSGVGIGIERDRFSSSPSPRLTTCPDGIGSGPECAPETVDMSTRADFTTLLLLLGGMGDEWGLRVGFGRVAGTFRSSWEGRTTGRTGEVPPADLGEGTIAWSRGADGGVLVVEVLRRLPIPGPFPLSLQGAFRSFGIRMKGCVVGEYSPFCGGRRFTELQLGLHLGLRPVSPPSPTRGPR